LRKISVSERNSIQLCKYHYRPIKPVTVGLVTSCVFHTHRCEVFEVSCFLFWLFMWSNKCQCTVESLIYPATCLYIPMC